MDKLERERAALEHVYARDDLESVTHADSPDFAVTRRGSPGRFGVEVTDIYPTQSDARLIHRPEYITRLFAGGAHMHKDDIDVLQVVTVEVTDKDGNVKATDVPAVFRETSDGRPRFEAIEAAIRTKSARYVEYADGLSHVNLIIVVYFPEAVAWDAEYGTAQLFSSGVREALIASPFQDVYLVGTDRAGVVYHRPLLELMFLEKLFLFRHALAAFEEDSFDLSIEALIPLFVTAMSRLGLDVYYSQLRGEDCAVFRAAAAHYSSEKGTVIYDLHDQPLPSRMSTPSVEMDPALLQKFLDFHSEYSLSNGMLTRFAMRSPSVETPPG